MQKYLSLAISLFCVLFVSCVEGREPPFPYSEVEGGFVTQTGDPQKLVEFFFLKPHGKGPFPVIFLPVANHDLGAKALVDFGYLTRFASEGVVAVAISAPGFGASEGERDFSGPNSQKAIIAVIDHFKILPMIDRTKMAIYGMNRNATLASMVSAHCTDLSLQILESGEYDLTLRREYLPDYLKSLGLQANMLKEVGDDPQALMDRSSLYHTQTVHQKTLILHGELDNHHGLPSARALHEKLIEEGKESYLKIYSNGLHELGREKWGDVVSFLREHFFGLVGIGIKLEQIGSVIQIAKVLADSPAALSGKLRVGDTILGISPNNDEFVINAVDLPLKEAISHIRGKKKSAVRLHVAHFDYETEEVVVERVGW